MERFQADGGIRVRFQGDLGIGRNAEDLKDAVQDVRQSLGAEIAGGAAAEIDRIHGIPVRRLQERSEGSGVGVHPALAVGQGVEIAVNALLPAKWNVEIKP